MRSPVVTSGLQQSHNGSSASSAQGSHLAVLLICLTVPLLGALLEVVDSGQHVALSFWPRWQLPDVCLSRVWFHCECPGCGLTRSVVHLMHGRWEASFFSHRLGWFVFSLIVSQIPYRLWRLGMNRFKGNGSRSAGGRIAPEKSTTFSEFVRAGSDADAVA